MGVRAAGSKRRWPGWGWHVIALAAVAAVALAGGACSHGHASRPVSPAITSDPLWRLARAGALGGLPDGRPAILCDTSGGTRWYSVTWGHPTTGDAGPIVAQLVAAATRTGWVADREPPSVLGGARELLFTKGDWAARIATNRTGPSTFAELTLSDYAADCPPGG